ncbi:hypothetical protein DAEQUDRAFT_75984 [Daedalea quercina L-15889]|uniref:Uncharacterized protein n=1 Tax=Daedalea quercina L-15889 TaxID=1314783 RepID=A0A165SED2_9APHY|nr:hypothetical protein DAEQUDRAFT_75984 [Daedalea quercina L-15889]
MPLFKSKAQKAEQARAADTQHHGMNDPNTAPQGSGAGPGVGTHDYVQNNNVAPGHVNAVDRHGASDHHQNDMTQNQAAPGYTDQGYTGAGHAGTGRNHGGPVDRAEQHVENLVGARAVRNQAGEKEQEVNAIKGQSVELQEAERLEREAKMHRDRAVAAGAHPANQRLGAGWQK